MTKILNERLKCLQNEFQTPRKELLTLKRVRKLGSRHSITRGNCNKLGCARRQSLQGSQQQHQPQQQQQLHVPKRMHGRCKEMAHADTFEADGTDDQHLHLQQLVQKQAIKIQILEEHLKYTKLYYRKQVAGIKFSAQMLERQLNRLQQQLQEETQRHAAAYGLCDSHYQNILSMVERMQKTGKIVFGIPTESTENLLTDTRCCQSTYDFVNEPMACIMTQDDKTWLGG